VSIQIESYHKSHNDSTERFIDLDKLSMAKFAHNGFCFKFKLIFFMFPAVSKNDTHYKSAQKRLKSNQLLVKIRDTLCFGKYF